ncbi:hypothetical protein TNCV_872921 [Trichonephila clavipes]|nr:hypothetical protein TNCV_872921 [Trichonephila clavipes]
MFIDESLMSDNTNAGAGVFSEFLSFYAPVGRGAAFDDEIDAIRVALSQLQCHLEKFTGTVMLSISRAALLASDNNPITQDALDCHHDLKNLVRLPFSLIISVS